MGGYHSDRFLADFLLLAGSFLNMEDNHRRRNITKHRILYSPSQRVPKRLWKVRQASTNGVCFRAEFEAFAYEIGTVLLTSDKTKTPSTSDMYFVEFTVGRCILHAL